MKNTPRPKPKRMPRLFNSMPNIFAGQLRIDDKSTKAAREARFREFQGQLRIAVNAFEVAKISIGQAVMALLEVQKALLPVIAEDVALCLHLHGDSEKGFRKAYSILSPAFSELPKLAMLFDHDLNQAFFRSTEANGVEFEQDEFVAGLTTGLMESVPQETA